MKSFLDLVKECDTFPYATKDPVAYTQATSNLYTLLSPPTPTTPSTPIGYILTHVLSQLSAVPPTLRGPLNINHSEKTVLAFFGSREKERSKLVAATCQYWREKGIFEVLRGWRDELYPVYGRDGEVLWSVERSASPLFGILSYGVHMTAYTNSPHSPFSLKLWIPRRAPTKQTFPSLLDNTVAGGTSTGESPFTSLIREASEEASLPPLLVSSLATPHSTITYIYVRDSRAGGEIGLLQPECEYIYDLELPNDVTPKPCDGEVTEFYLWDVDEVKEAMGRGEFKPNCAMVLVDFFVRRGVITRENEAHYDEIKERMHRKMEFPGPHGT